MASMTSAFSVPESTPKIAGALISRPGAILALDLEEPGKDRPDILCAALNQLFHQTVERRIMRSPIPGLHWCVVTPWNTREGLPWPGIPPVRARNAISDKFPDVRL